MTVIYQVKNTIGHQIYCPEGREALIKLSVKAHAVEIHIFHASILPYSATQTAAMPIPVPTHILVTPTFCPVRLSSVNNVPTCLAPVQPNG